MLIEISGIDGSGKTTIQKHVRRRYVDRGVNTWERSFRSSFRLMFADIAANEGFGHWSELFEIEQVEMAHAVEMLSLVGPHLSHIDLNRSNVVTDTYTSRWLATASMWESQNIEDLVRVFSRLPSPDLSIHLRVDPYVAYDRLRSRVEGDSVLKMGSPAKVERYAKAFEDTLDKVPYPVDVIEANRGIDRVLEDVWRLLDSRIAEVR